MLRHVFSSLTLVVLIWFSSCGSGVPDRKTWLEAAAQKNLGVAYIERGDYDGAVAAFREIGRLLPDEPLGYANLAIAHLERQEIDQADQAIRKALNLAPDDAEIMAIQADIAMTRNRPEQALAILKKATTADQTDASILYRYFTFASRVKTSDSSDKPTIRLRTMLAMDPENVAIVSELVQNLVDEGAIPEALSPAQEMARLLAPVPEPIAVYLDNLLAALRDGRAGDARRQINILNNLLKVDPVYRAGRSLLGDPTQTAPPLRTFRAAPEGLFTMSADTMITIAFTDVSKEMQPSDLENTSGENGWHDLSLTDFDGDNRIDLILAGDRGVRFYRGSAQGWETAPKTGIDDAPDSRRIVFADIDNDGDMDVFILRPEEDRLFRNDGAQGYTRVKNPALRHMEKSGDGFAFFADFDHDGDLDLLRGGDERLRFYRNIDGTLFEDATDETGMASALSGQTAAAYGDFDRDGALDVFIASQSGDPFLYRNIRQGRWIENASRFAVPQTPGVTVALSRDFDNDGRYDLFLAGTDSAACRILWNTPKRRFDTGNTPETLRLACRDFVVTSAVALDFDNDGFLDVAIAGNAATGAPGLRLLRNLGSRRFEDATALIQNNPAVVYDLEAEDIDNDGDMDIVAWTDNGLLTLRNDGGNANRWMKIRLEGALSGGSKNNFYGVGSTLEVTTQTHYQNLPVYAPVTHIGLGNYERADALRVLWTNGVPQNTVNPEPSTLVVEQQRLKGSCPSLYTWNGDEYVFVTHLMTRSAIGAINETGQPAYPDAANDYVRIRGDQLKPQNGLYRMNIVEELWDAVYMDKLQLIVIDHPDSMDILVDEKYMPPPYPSFPLHTVTRPRLPVAAFDHHGHDILPHLVARDSLYAGDFAPGNYQGLTETHSITLDPGKLSRNDHIMLYLCGWIMPIEPSAGLALSQRPRPGVIPPYLEVPDGRGGWKTVISYTGFPSGEHKTIAIDLTGKFLTEDYRVRITDNLQLYWSEAFFTVNEPEKPDLRVFRLSPKQADLHYRGFSREYRTVENGPYLRDYSSVDRAPQWLPFEGYRTRYGDVTGLLQEADNRYVIYSSGEEVSVVFNGNDLPPLPDGWTRDYALHSDGWLKEGDLNTDTAATIEPLPFRGMSTYPYGPDEHYPVTPEHLSYLREYVTRWVSQ